MQPISIVNWRPAEKDRRKSDYEIDNAHIQRQTTLSKLTTDAKLASKELEVSKNYQTTDDQVYSKLEILESAIDTRLAAERKTHAETSFDIQGELAAADIELLEIEGHKADLKIEMAEDALDELEVRAPHDGIIVLERNWQGQTAQVGEVCWPGQALAGLPDLETLQAEVWVLEADAGGIKPGNPVVVTVESLPERPFQGIVSSIDPHCPTSRPLGPGSVLPCCCRTARNRSHSDETRRQGQGRDRNGRPR